MHGDDGSEGLWWLLEGKKRVEKGEKRVEEWW